MYNHNDLRNLQLARMLAPDTGSGEGGENTANEGANEPSFDEMLKNPAYQAEFDRRVQKALLTNSGKNEDAKRRAVAEAIEEGKRLAGLSAEEQLSEMRKALERDRAEIAAQKLDNQARTLAMENGLDAQAVKWLRYATEDEARENVLALKAYIDKAADEKAQARIRERMAGKTPGGSGSTEGAGRQNGVRERFFALHPELKGN